MFNIGPVELMVVLVLALLVFGPSKLPELLGSVGQAIREFQRASRELTEVFQETQQDFQSALDLDAQHQTEQSPAASEVAVEEAVVAEAPPSVTAQPEEFETAAAMIDPVEPFQPPVEPEPEPIAAVAEPIAKPKRVRRKKPVEAELTTTVTEGVSAATPLSNGAVPHANGTAPKPRRRRAAVAASDESA